LEDANWTTANTPPATSAAGQLSRSPRRPSTIAIRMNGTSSARKGT